MLWSRALLAANFFSQKARRVAGKTVPEAAINKHHETPLGKDEVRSAWQAEMPAPSLDAYLPKQAREFLHHTGFLKMGPARINIHRQAADEFSIDLPAQEGLILRTSGAADVSAAKTKGKEGRRLSCPCRSQKKAGPSFA